jgi:siderophore synthetase component
LPGSDVKALALHTDVFDGFLRHLSPILDTDGLLPEKTFWTEVAR